MEVNNFRPTMIEKRQLIYLNRLNFTLLLWLLQRFRHIWMKNKDAKVVVSLFFLIENCDYFLTRHMAVMSSKGLRIHYISVVCKST